MQNYKKSERYCHFVSLLFFFDSIKGDSSELSGISEGAYWLLIRRPKFQVLQKVIRSK